jgi:hypothetical protein
MANFASVLDRKSAEIEKPKPYPVGGLVIQLGQFKEVEMGKDKTPALEFESTIRDVMPDVNMADYGGTVVGKPYRLRFFLTEDSAWRLDDFLTKILQIPDDGSSLRQRLAQAPSRLCVVNNKHRPSADGSVVYNDQGTFAPAP